VEGFLCLDTEAGSLKKPCGINGDFLALVVKCVVKKKGGEKARTKKYPANH
jgi:hypothetical protein